MSALAAGATNVVVCLECARKHQRPGFLVRAFGSIRHGSCFLCANFRATTGLIVEVHQDSLDYLYSLKEVQP